VRATWLQDNSACQGAQRVNGLTTSTMRPVNRIEWTPRLSFGKKNKKQNVECIYNMVPTQF